MPAAPPALRTALIGFGLAGRVFHAPLITAAEGLTLTGVVTSDPDRADQARRQVPGVTVLPSVDRLFADPAQFDLVVVASTNESHAGIAEAALRLGKPVVVDKPLAITAQEAAQVVRTAEAVGVPLTVFQNRRWDSDQLTLRRLIRDGRLGRVLRYESRFERWRPQLRPGSWREVLPPQHGGGLLLDLGSHLIDQALTLFGPVCGVYAEVDARRGVADDDVFVAMEHANGVRSHLWAGALAGSPGPRLRVLGTSGAYLVQDLDGQEAELTAEGRLPAAGFHEPPTRWGHLVTGQDVVQVPSEPGGWVHFYPAVVAGVRGGSMPVDPRDAVRTLEVIEAARRSAAARTVVNVTA